MASGKLRATLDDLLRKRDPSSLAGATTDSSIEGIDPESGISFKTVIVKDVLSNPVDYFSRTYAQNDLDRLKGVTVGEALKSTSSGMGISNPELLDIAPRNSILGYDLSSASSNSDARPELFFPFFPSHLAFPVKAGESVWALYDERGIGYWLFRKPSYRQVEDVNYTVAQREGYVATLEESYDIKSKKATLDNETYDHIVDRATSFPAIDNIQPTTDLLVNESISYREEFVGEPVPRYSKKCGDLILQGSNNTLISLGVDNSFLSDYRDDFENTDSTLLIDKDTSYNAKLNQQQNKNTPLFGLPKIKPEMAGCIDLVVGRGILDLKRDSVLNDDSLISTAGRNALFVSFPLYLSKNIIQITSQLTNKNGVIKSIRASTDELNYYEIDKSSEFMEDRDLKNNGDIKEEGAYESLLDSSARFYVSMRSAPNAKWKSIIEKTVGDDPDIKSTLDNFLGTGKSAIVSSAYSIKQYARGNCDIQSAAGGSMYVSDSVVGASAGGAYTHLKPDGNISIVHSPGKRIKLGSENATEDAVLGNKLKSLLEQLCTQISLLTVVTAVGPSSPPVNAPAINVIKTQLSMILSKSTKLT